MEDAYSKAKAYAFRRLAMKNQPSAELRKKLAEKGFSDEITEKVVLECQSSGFLSDEEWLKQFISGQIRKAVGPHAIFQKLLQKGISRERAQKALAQHSDENAQKESIHAFIQKRSRGKDLSNPLERQKMVQALQRKGFPLSLILEGFEKKGDLW
jgi:regulatory protein